MNSSNSGGNNDDAFDWTEIVDLRNKEQFNQKAEKYKSVSEAMKNVAEEKLEAQISSCLLDNIKSDAEIYTIKGLPKGFYILPNALSA